MKLKIKITKDILERSKMCGIESLISTNCALALAIRDLFPRASIGYDIMCYGVGSGDIYNLPKEASAFIDGFDSTPPNLRPFLAEQEIELEIPDEVIEKINIDELKPLLENHPTLELIQ